MTRRYILAIDQGTTSTRALIATPGGAIVATASAPVAQHYPRDGWVEHDGEQILASVTLCLRKVLERIDASDVAGIGIANQRETTLLWDRETGVPLHRAIVWQDRRTAAFCDRLRADGRETAIQAKTGLLADPYFSGTKLAWLLEHVPGARERARAGRLAFGTVDSWIIWKLTGGRVHATDATNASRTMFFDIHKNTWDAEILDWLGIPASLLPEVRDCAADFGTTAPEVLGVELPILGVAGDQQAAAIGQACLRPGTAKCTYGTGAFMLLNTGANVPRSEHRLLGTIGYRLGGTTSYALEGSLFMAGAVLEWARDAGIANSAEEVSELARSANGASKCYLVPAFTGLGAPYWSAGARGALVGMTRDTGRAEIAAAALDSVCYQTRDLLEAMQADTGVASDALRVDGGMSRSDGFLQRLADLTGVEVVRAATHETTAIGAVYVAALQAGLLPDVAAIETLWRPGGAFSPRMSGQERDGRYADWCRAVQRVL